MDIHIYSAEINTFTTQIFDIYYAYRQYLNRANNYVSEVNITISDQIKTRPGAINVKCVYMPDNIPDIDDYDLVFFDNDCHSLEVATGYMKANINNPKCYFITGSYTDVDYEFHNKLIWAPMFILIGRDYMARPFYPHYFERHFGIANGAERKPMVFINGQNRTHRQYFIDALDKFAPGVRQRENGFNNATNRLLDSIFESAEDSAFRTMVNDTIVNQDNYEETKQSYYGRSITVGIDNKFGRIPPGNSMIDEYFDYHCVLYPDSNWINNTAYITEKTTKCFAARSIPWPVGGKHINRLLNMIGFRTAWNLLPAQYQTFDDIDDHATRYQECARAVDWASGHPEIWTTEQAQKLKDHNHDLLFSNTLDINVAQQLDTIFTK
jgi:hypothetical protein